MFHTLPTMLSFLVSFPTICAKQLPNTELQKGGKGYTKKDVICFRKDKKNNCGIKPILNITTNFLILLFTVGEVEKPCVLSLVDDTLYEEGEELRLVLGNPKSDSQFGASVGALNETLVKIKDTADSK